MNSWWEFTSDLGMSSNNHELLLILNHPAKKKNSRSESPSNLWTSHFCENPTPPTKSPIVSQKSHWTIALEHWESHKNHQQAWFKPKKSHDMSIGPLTNSNSQDPYQFPWTSPQKSYEFPLNPIENPLSRAAPCDPPRRRHSTAAPRWWRWWPLGRHRSRGHRCHLWEI